MQQMSEPVCLVVSSFGAHVSNMSVSEVFTGAQWRYGASGVAPGSGVPLLCQALQRKAAQAASGGACTCARANDEQVQQ